MKNFYISEEEKDEISKIKLTNSISSYTLSGLSIVGAVTGSTGCLKMLLLLGLIEFMKY